MTTFATLLWAISLAMSCWYVLLFAVAAAGRRRTRTAVPSRGAPIVVVVVPARNEQVVIERTIERVQQIEGDPLLLVVDDGSDDETARVARDAGDPARTIVLSRERAVAGRGKGDVLNEAAAFIGRLVAAGDPRLGGRGPDDVVVCILDADGWLDPDVVTHVAPCFDDPRVAGVQVSVRMFNARAGFLARMQDIEFVAYGHLFQTARDVLGSVLMGGNGQFMRLSALQQLGASPWSECLTEDLDIGLRLTRRGWRMRACPQAWVAQQAIDEPSRFLRQRTRWVQGHLTCWRHLPGLWSTRAPIGIVARLDLTMHLLLGLYGLIALAQIATLIALLGGHVDAARIVPGVTQLGAATLVAVLMVLPILVVAITYQQRAVARLPATTLAGVLVTYLTYHYLWSIPATLLALMRIAVGRRGWSKTARTSISHYDLAADVATTGALR